MRNNYIVSYDICDEKRLRQVFRICKNHGYHLQYSVFECDLTTAEKCLFEDKLKAVINQAEDQILFIDLGPSNLRGARVITHLGVGYSKIDEPCFVV